MLQTTCYITAKAVTSLCILQLWDTIKAASKKREKKKASLRFVSQRYFPTLKIILKGLTASLAQFVFCQWEYSVILIHLWVTRL